MFKFGVGAWSELHSVSHNSGTLLSPSSSPGVLLVWPWSVAQGNFLESRGLISPANLLPYETLSSLSLHLSGSHRN